MNGEPEIKWRVKAYTHESKSHCDNFGFNLIFYYQIKEQLNWIIPLIEHTSLYSNYAMCIDMLYIVQLIYGTSILIQNLI